MAEVIVDDREVVRMLRRASEAVEDLPERIAEMVAEEANEASRSRGVTWRPQTEPELGAVAEQWWAHLLARGTRPHGPRRASRLRFVVRGEVVWALQVTRLPPDPFDERAVVAARSRLDEVLRQALAEVA